MVAGGEKKTRTVGNRAHKNTDKIGFTVLTFSEGLRVYSICGCTDVSACGKHVNLCMCPGACVSVYVHRGGCACMLILACLLQTEWEDRKKKKKDRNLGPRRVGLMEEGTHFPASHWKPKTTTALHYTLLLTTGGACSLRGTAERAGECTRQIIFIWDPGGYWQTGGAFR